MSIIFGFLPLLAAPLSAFAFKHYADNFYYCEGKTYWDGTPFTVNTLQTYGPLPSTIFLIGPKKFKNFDLRIQGEKTVNLWYVDGVEQSIIRPATTSTSSH